MYAYVISCLCQFQPPPISIIIIIIMKGVWSRHTAVANPDSPRMTSVRGLEDEGVEGDRVCIIRIRGRATPFWTCPTSHLRCHLGRKAKMRIVTGSVALVSPAKVRNYSLPPVVNVNNAFYFLRKIIGVKLRPGPFCTCEGLDKNLTLGIQICDMNSLLKETEWNWR